MDLALAASYIGAFLLGSLTTFTSIAIWACMDPDEGDGWDDFEEIAQ